MKVIGLDHRPHILQLNKKKRNAVSSYHERARTLLNKIFNHSSIYEEVYLGGSKENNSKGLYADFLIPSHKLIVEVQGEQHLKQTAFFHETKLDFLASKRRDRTKQEWCILNGFTLVELMYNQSDEDWQKVILLGLAE